ncbi:hypothetical protein U0070_002799 [Myodes glareolus]|uniref:Uncharacterized protein n=1 Tax=Myodes glareolus TaxID=447135 RepID=A0AAW0HIU0_MYOGA
MEIWLMKAEFTIWNKARLTLQVGRFVGSSGCPDGLSKGSVGSSGPCWFRDLVSGLELRNQLCQGSWAHHHTAGIRSEE